MFRPLNHLWAALSAPAFISLNTKPVIEVTHGTCKIYDGSALHLKMTLGSTITYAIVMR